MVIVVTPPAMACVVLAARADPMDDALYGDPLMDAAGAEAPAAASTEGLDTATTVSSITAAPTVPAVEEPAAKVEGVGGEEAAVAEEPPPVDPEAAFKVRRRRMGGGWGWWWYRPPDCIWRLTAYGSDTSRARTALSGGWDGLPASAAASSAQPGCRGDAPPAA